MQTPNRKEREPKAPVVLGREQQEQLRLNAVKRVFHMDLVFRLDSACTRGQLTQSCQPEQLSANLHPVGSSCWPPALSPSHASLLSQASQDKHSTEPGDRDTCQARLSSPELLLQEFPQFSEATCSLRSCLSQDCLSLSPGGSAQHRALV